MKTLLSIDLDYFGNAFFPFNNKKLKERVEKEFCELFDFISSLKEKNKGLEIFLVDCHDEVLDVFDKYEVDKLINIDYHSDTYDEHIMDYPHQPNLATWVNYYAYKEKCVYEWRFPSLADCIDAEYGLINSMFGEVSWLKGTKVKNGFKKSKRKCGLKGLDFGDVQAIGVCLSWNFGAENEEKRFTDISVIEKLMKNYSHLFSDEVSQEIIDYIKGFSK